VPPLTVSAMTTRSEPLSAGGEWLLSAAPAVDRARARWADAEVAWLRPGDTFTAVIVQASVMHQAVGRPGPQECAQVLGSFLDGPVFHRPVEFGPEGGYTVLLPASAAGIWRVAVTVVLPRAAQFLLPAPDRLEPAGDAPWWGVPPAGPDALCTPALLASFLALRIGAEGGQEGGHV
jgi:hypothetical protein